MLHKAAPTKAEATEDVVPKPKLRSIIVGVLALCLFWAVVAPFIGESNGGIIIIFLSMFVAWLFLCNAAIARWGGTRGSGLVVSILAIPGTLIGLYVLFLAEITAIGWILHAMPPPRPMFCNRFVDDERTLLPYWYSPRPVVDHFGHWAWADYADNVMLVVATGIPARSRTNGISPGTHETKVGVGDDRQNRFLTLKKSHDELVVVLPSGSFEHFMLGPGLARQFDEARHSKSVKNVLRESGELLGSTERAKFERFLKDYQEPRTE